jgi:hypothetical protein
MAPLFEHYGVQLWMPKVGGRVDYASEHDEKTMTGLGLSSKREITRTRIRVRTAMAVQTREQGRYLGGRPPHGYRLADAGPHPNKAHAAWGRRAHRLDPYPATAPTVRWIFVQRLAEHSIARIARALNEAGVPCPSAADPGRNTHRTGAGWTLGTVATILENPRYTGRQVWNRQRTDSELADPANVTLGHRSVQRWNLPDGWVISNRPAHPALVSEDDFVAVQGINAVRGPVPQDEPVLRRYLLAGLLACGVCGRRMESAWTNGKAAYRCRHGRTSAMAPNPSRPKNTYIREDKLLPHLPALHLLLTTPAVRARRRNADRPALAEACARGDDLACPETGGYGELLCPRASRQVRTFLRSLVSWSSGRDAGSLAAPARTACRSCVHGASQLLMTPFRSRSVAGPALRRRTRPKLGPPPPHRFDQPSRQPSRAPSTTRCAMAQRVAAARFDTPILV